MSGTTIHCLKSWPAPFAAVWSGVKTFEVRRDDRSYANGDVLVLQEWDPSTREHTGREVVCRVRYLWRDWHLVGLSDHDVVVMGIEIRGNGRVRGFAAPPGETQAEARARLIAEALA